MRNVNKIQIVDTFQTAKYLRVIKPYKYLFFGYTRLGFLIQLIVMRLHNVQQLTLSFSENGM